MKPVFSFLCVIFILASFVVPVAAGTILTLEYDAWLWFYDLVDSEENYNIWLGMYSYGGSEELYPIHVDEDLYLAKMMEVEGIVVDETHEPADTEPVELPVSDIDTLDESLESEPVVVDSPVAEISTGTQSSNPEGIATMAVTVPTSGQSYILPELVEVGYAPDASSGSLLSVLYGLLGKPVVSYTYKVRTSNSSSAYDGYLVQHIEYDAAWIASVVLLIVVLYCIFKAGGAMICKV